MHIIRESNTRKYLIDPQLEQAGWHLRDKSRVKLEIPVDGYEEKPWNDTTDYYPFQENGEVIAIDEAKHTSHDARMAKQQVEHYAVIFVKKLIQSIRNISNRNTRQKCFSNFYCTKLFKGNCDERL